MKDLVKEYMVNNGIKRATPAQQKAILCFLAQNRNYKKKCECVCHEIDHTWEKNPLNNCDECENNHE